jgi:pentatricopeptide repeat protein
MMSALGNMKRARNGREAHAQVVTRGLCGNIIVESRNVCQVWYDGGCTQGIRQDEGSECSFMVCPAWGYCQTGKHEKVLSLFRHMYMQEQDDDWYSLGTLLQSFAGLSAVKLGKEIHYRSMRMRGCGDVIVESALVDLYAKCGAVDYAYRVFKMSSVRNMITWNAMICGCAQNGHGERTISLFNEMVRGGVKPDYMSFIGVLFCL